MTRYITVLITITIFLLQSCGLTTKELISDGTNSKNIHISAVTSKGISISVDGGTKWTRHIDNDTYQGKVLEVKKLRNNIKIITTKGLYTLDKKITLNIKTSIDDALFLGNQGYLVSNKNLYKIEKESTLITVNRLNNSYIENFNGEIVSISGNQIIKLSSKESWQELYRCETTIESIIGNPEYLLISTPKQVIKLSYQKQQLQSTILKIATANIKNSIHNISTKGDIYLVQKTILKRTSSGETWDSFTEDTGFIESKITDINIKGLNIYLATPKGIVYSLNGGETWHKFSKAHGLLASTVEKLFIQ